MNIGSYKLQGDLGIDVSKWQADIDWMKVKNDGVKWAILREGYGQTIDAYFVKNVKGCKQAGIPILGVYHFSYALSAAQAKAEATFCLNNMRAQGLDDSVIAFYDFEYDTVTKAKAKGIVLGPKECDNFSQTFCLAIEAGNRSAGIYMNLDYYRNWYTKATKDRFMLWLADYSGGLDYPCAIRQFMSSGKVNGINGNVDMNERFVLSNKLVAPSAPAIPTPSQPTSDGLDAVAKDVIAGKYGNGDARKEAITKAVQDRVNKLLK